FLPDVAQTASSRKGHVLHAFDLAAEEVVEQRGGIRRRAREKELRLIVEVVPIERVGLAVRHEAPRAGGGHAYLARGPKQRVGYFPREINYWQRNQVSRIGRRYLLVQTKGAGRQRVSRVSKVMCGSKETAVAVVGKPSASLDGWFPRAPQVRVASD